MASASAMKKPTAAALGLRQSSILSFFSKPSPLQPAQPPFGQKTPSQKALMQQLVPDHPDGFILESSCSSDQQDDGETLTWSQLLAGGAAWSSAAHPVSGDDERAAQVALKVSKKKRSRTPRRSPCQGNGKKSHSETESDELSVTESDHPETVETGKLSSDGPTFMRPDGECFREDLIAEEAGVALNVEPNLQIVELHYITHRMTEEKSVKPFQVKNSPGYGELEMVKVHEGKDSHGYGELEMVKFHEEKDSHGHDKLEMANLHHGRVDPDVSAAENASPPPLAAEGIGITMVAEVKTTFLKFKRGSGRRVSAPEEPLEAPITDYEREREENIHRNQCFLENLGISSSALAINKKSTSWRQSIKPRGKAVSKVNPPPLPLRRSRRLLRDSAELHIQPHKEAAESMAHEGTADEEAFFYDDSSVLKYTCEEGVSNSVSYPCHGSVPSNAKNILGFQPLNRVLQDAYLTRIYTMSACFIAQSQRALLAAGGHQGLIAVFGTSCIDAKDTSRGDSTTTVAVEKELSQEMGSLLSWKGSSGWISGVKFLSSQTQENAMLLLSSANDGKLVLWDINKQQKVQHSGTPLAGLPPFKVTEAKGIHSNGIFSMHEFAGHVATASKDSTIGYSRITGQEIITERSISGHHSGAIRGVNFRDAFTIADCGGDGLICVLDLRMVEPCALTIDTADATGLNVVEWCPSQDHLLLSASKVPQLSIHDMRNPKEPLHRLSGHVNPKLQRCSQIYRPTFVAEGRAIASPGQGSKALSLYSVDTGEAISRGLLGYDATMVMWTACQYDSSSALWVAARHISQLIPLWQT